MSPAYVVIRVKNTDFPSAYIVSILKHDRYLKVIMNYSLSSARASLPFSELKRIKIPRPSLQQIETLIQLDNELQDSLKETDEINKKLLGFTTKYLKSKTDL